MAWNSPDFILDPTSSTDCLGVYLKRTCSRVTSASSALAVLNDYALYKSTQSLTHSLTNNSFTQLLTHSVTDLARNDDRDGFTAVAQCVKFVEASQFKALRVQAELRHPRCAPHHTLLTASPFCLVHTVGLITLCPQNVHLLSVE